MSATGSTPVYIYASGTTGNIPSASNLTNTTNGSEIALNYFDGKLFYKNASNSVVTVPLLQSSGSQNGWLSSTDWTTFNNKQTALVSGTNIKTVGGNSLLGSGNVNTFSTDITVNNLTVGIGAGSVASNSVFGYQAGNGNTTGANMTYVGYQAGYTKSTGFSVTAFGYKALYFNTGDNNTAVGVTAAYTNSSGSQNCAIGEAALYTNSTGSYNTSVGQASLFSNTSNNNVAVGYQAGYATTGNDNTYVGFKAGTVNTSGTVNTYIGSNAGFSSTGSYNTFVGSGSSWGAGAAVTSGTKNTILGGYTGNQGGLDIRTLSNYIVLSDGDGNPRIVGFPTGGVSIGNTTDPGAANLSVSDTIISRSSNGSINSYTGLQAWGTGGSTDAIAVKNTNTSTLSALSCWNSSGTYIGGISNTSTGTSLVASSDYRLKDDVQPIANATKTIEKLNPVTYKWKLDDSFGQGFIAHELQQIFPDAVFGEKDAVNEDGTIKPQGIDQTKIIATLVAAFKELNAKFEEYVKTHP